MAIVSPATPVSGVPPSSAWIRFLRSYGPTPNNTTLFDEYTVDALKRAKVQPIALASSQLKGIFERIDSGLLGSILIAGTAGDGKTYHCRSLWMHLGGSPAEWADKAPASEVRRRGAVQRYLEFRRAGSRRRSSSPRGPQAAQRRSSPAGIPR